MIKILKDAFWTHMNCACCENDDKMYDMILDALEQQGMKAPSYLLQDGDLGSKFINDWEHEDEKE
jgi:hypothetical protein